MAFLDDFGKKLSTAADLAVDKAKDLAEIGKLKLDIAAEETDRPKDSPGELALKHGDRQRHRQQPERLCRPELEQPGRSLQNSTKKAQQRIADPFDDLAPASFPA